MVNLANLLELVAGGEPIEVIDRDTTTSIDPKKEMYFYILLKSMKYFQYIQE